MTRAKAKELWILLTNLKVVAEGPQLIYPSPVLGKKPELDLSDHFLWGAPEVSARKPLVDGPADEDWSARYRSLFQHRRGSHSSTVTYDPVASTKKLLSIIDNPDKPLSQNLGNLTSYPPR